MSASKTFTGVFLCALVCLLVYAVLATNFSTLTRPFFVSVGSLINQTRDLVPQKFVSYIPDSLLSSPQVQYVTPQLLPCDWTPQTFLRPTRSQCYVTCNVTNTVIAFREVPSNVTPSLTSLPANNTSCLKRVIAQHCNCCGRKIPKIAHYVRFGPYNLSLDAFISVLSVARFVKPCLIVFHGDSIPHGPYWSALLHLVPNMVHMHAVKPTEIFGRKIKVVEHAADVKRLRLMIEYGGMYLDTDYVVLRSLDDLLKESVVLGYEHKGRSICNGFLVSEANSTFMQIWLDNYKDFNDRQWAEHSVRRPYRLSVQHPTLLKVVETFHKPNFAEMHVYYDRKRVAKFDWSDNYGLHFYTRVVRKQFNQKRIDKQDNVIGDMVRHVLYSDQHACKNM
ncbi:uncharacterized protein [Littorina saxatilis]|uniref:Alpha-1,4-N-acetylglucosaminyltransferase n=1 Tax=Littorina saxatilis TaxID=31220 RepID=A0AAN9AQD9_9CAEN